MPAAMTISGLRAPRVESASGTVRPPAEQQQPPSSHHANTGFVVTTAARNIPGIGRGVSRRSLPSFGAPGGLASGGQTPAKGGGGTGPASRTVSVSGRVSQPIPSSSSGRGRGGGGRAVSRAGPQSFPVGIPTTGVDTHRANSSGVHIPSSCRPFSGVQPSPERGLDALDDSTLQAQIAFSSQVENSQGPAAAAAAAASGHCTVVSVSTDVLLRPSPSKVTFPTTETTATDSSRYSNTRYISARMSLDCDSLSNNMGSPSSLSSEQRSSSLDISGAGKPISHGSHGNVIRVDSLGRKRCESLSGEILPLHDLADHWTLPAAGGVADNTDGGVANKHTAALATGVQSSSSSSSSSRVLIRSASLATTSSMVGMPPMQPSIQEVPVGDDGSDVGTAGDAAIGDAAKPSSSNTDTTSAKKDGLHDNGDCDSVFSGMPSLAEAAERSLPASPVLSMGAGPFATDKLPPGEVSTAAQASHSPSVSLVSEDKAPARKPTPGSPTIGQPARRSVPVNPPAKAIPLSLAKSWKDTSKSLPSSFSLTTEPTLVSTTVDLRGCDGFLTRKDARTGETMLKRLEKHPSFIGSKLEPSLGQPGKVQLSSTSNESLESCKEFLNEAIRILRPFVLHNHHLIELGKFEPTAYAMLLKEGKRQEFPLPTSILQDIHTGNLYALVQDISVNTYLQFVEVLAQIVETLRRIKMRIQAGPVEDIESSAKSTRSTGYYSRQEILALYSSPLSSQRPRQIMLMDLAVKGTVYATKVPIVEGAKAHPFAGCC